MQAGRGFRIGASLASGNHGDNLIPRGERLDMPEGRRLSSMHGRYNFRILAILPDEAYRGIFNVVEDIVCVIHSARRPPLTLR